MSGQYLDTEKRPTFTKEYVKLNEYDHSMRIAPQLSMLRYALVPGSVKKMNQYYEQIPDKAPLQLNSYFGQSNSSEKRLKNDDGDYVSVLSRKN